MTAATAPERGLTLYELTDEYAAIKRLLDAEEEASFNSPDTASAALTEVLDRLGTAIEKKAEGILMVYSQQNAEADLIGREAEIFEAHAKALRARESAKRNGAERLKDYLALELGKLGDDTQKFETVRVRATLSKRPEKDRVVVVDEDRLPVSFKIATLKMPAQDVPPELARHVVSVAVAKAELNQYAEDTGILPIGCRTEPGKRSLRIY